MERKQKYDYLKALLVAVKKMYVENSAEMKADCDREWDYADLLLLFNEFNITFSIKYFKI